MTNPRSLETVLHYPDAISQVSADGGDVYWLAAIAAEDGRITVRRLRDGEVTDLTPEASVRSRAMEYGGGAYSVDAGVLAWCDDRTRQVWVADESGRRPLTPEQARFINGGLVLSVTDGVLLAVREDHDAAPEPRTEIVALSLTGQWWIAFFPAMTIFVTVLAFSELSFRLQRLIENPMNRGD